MATLKEIVYKKIAEAAKHEGYVLHDEYWYVIPWMKGTWIHYTIKEISDGERILWYLCGTAEPPKWPVQTKFFEMRYKQ